MGFSFPSIEKILQGYQDKSLTPVDVAQQSIKAYREREPLYHAWECFDEEKLLAAAAQCAERLSGGELPRALEGIPVG